MFHILNILHQLGHRVTFIPDNLANIPPYGDELQKRGIEVVYHPYVKKVRDYLISHGREFDVVVLSRCDFARKHIADVRRYAPQSRIIFDTVDLHFLRTYREAELTSNPEIREKAREKRTVGVRLIDQTDETWVVSSAEQELLREERPHKSIKIVRPSSMFRARARGLACVETFFLSADSNIRQTSMLFSFSCRKFILW